VVFLFGYRGSYEAASDKDAQPGTQNRELSNRLRRRRLGFAAAAVSASTIGCSKKPRAKILFAFASIRDPTRI